LNYPILRKRDSYPYHQYLSRFEDGCVGFTQLRYFQVLQNSSVTSPEEIKSELEKARDTIINGLNMSVENPRVYEKYQWLKHQYEQLTILGSDIKSEIRSASENTIHYY